MTPPLLLIQRQRRSFRPLFQRIARTGLLASGLLFYACPASLRAFTKNETSSLEQSKTLMQELYHGETFRDPQLQRPAWQDPQEGILPEGRLWQDVIALLYEFFEITKKSYPKEFGGQDIQPGILLPDYQANRTRFQIALDRLYRAGLGDSFSGRGRTILSHLDLILKEMDAAIDSIVSSDGLGYRQSVLSIGTLTRMLDRVYSSPSRGGGKTIPGVDPRLIVLAGILALVSLFLALWSFLSLHQEKLHEKTGRYWDSSQKWAHEFNKQFIQMKVQYLVLAPLAAGMLLGLLSGNLTGFLVLSALGGLAGFYAPGVVLNFIRQQRGKKIERQLMDALILLSNALKSGLDIVQGFELVQRELSPPISEEFGLVLKNYKLGTPFEKAMEGLEERVESRLLSYLVKAVLIQRQAGGNLTKIFDRIVESIREEGKLEEKTKALTAQQRMQARVVGLMPWIMMTILFVIQPKMMAEFYGTPVGVLVILGTIVWELIGLGIIRSIANIKV